ncbi:MAG: ammonia-forming cytochrome c nitrite reductase subunit c552 [Verrucomicrobia bacterium]|nr:ammonia-forming cytochrome c nitrite reductase subunit c552 [Kiritimatiellia bacterium]MCO6400804.1 ammonia-forming cytochrome c nitrite reductase subunit c552 [Verrucomicrobiota bacterium]
MRKTTNGQSGGAVAYVLFIVVAAAFAVGIFALMSNIAERKAEARNRYVRVAQVDEDTTDPAVWGQNWPRQYDSYLKTALRTQTKFGGHGGSEAMPEEKIEREPWLKRMFLGYAFSIDYRDRRGHAYMLEDQEATQRLTKPQSGSCLHCHASIMPLYRELGGGDATKGLAESYKFSYQELHAKLVDSGHAHPVSCVDCHDPDSMQLRVTRPGFINGIRAFAESGEPAPQFASIEIWRESKSEKPYDPNRDATRQEMRSFVCAQCHVEYYCATKMPLEFPWGKGLRAEDLEAHWNGRTFEDGKRFFDYVHAESGAEILKTQHPEFELWSQGIHARSGVSCADCHMPYIREGATKVSDHWVRSPLLNVNRACQTCHKVPEQELLARVDIIQERNYDLMKRSAAALMDMLDAINAAIKAGATDEQLKPARELHRSAQWRIDFIAAENSMGFHAPQEAARILGEAIDMARQGEIAARAIISGAQSAAPAAAPET